MPVGNVTAYYTNTSLEQGITNGMFLVENTSVQLKTNECPFYHGVLNGSVNCSENLAIVDEPRGYNWPILFLTPLIFFGVGGNILVCMAISLEKRLQSVTNYFLLSLAITDLLVCIIVMPFTVINDFAGKEFPVPHSYSPKPSPHIQIFYILPQSTPHIWNKQIYQTYRIKNYFNVVLNSKCIFLYQTTKPVHVHVNTSTCNPTKRLRNHITTCIAKRMKKSKNPAQGSTEKMLRD